MSKYMLDASALLALLFKEAGQEKVSHVLEHAETLISILNEAEVACKLVLTGVPVDKAKQAMKALDLHSVPLTQELFFEAASLAKQTKPFGLSLGDCICLATAHHHQAIALKADRNWLKIPLQLKIELIR